MARELGLHKFLLLGDEKYTVEFRKSKTHFSNEKRLADCVEASIGAVVWLYYDEARSLDVQVCEAYSVFHKLALSRNVNYSAQKDFSSLLQRLPEPKNPLLRGLDQLFDLTDEEATNATAYFTSSEEAERLEFLGDAVLQSLVSFELTLRHSSDLNLDQHVLSVFRSALVRNDHLATRMLFRIRKATNHTFARKLFALFSCHDFNEILEISSKLEVKPNYYLVVGEAPSKIVEVLSPALVKPLADCYEASIAAVFSATRNFSRTNEVFREDIHLSTKDICYFFHKYKKQLLQDEEKACKNSEKMENAMEMENAMANVMESMETINTVAIVDTVAMEVLE